MPVRPRRLLPLAAVVLAVLTLAACTEPVRGRSAAGAGVLLGPVDTSRIIGSDGGGIDQIAAAALGDIDRYWQQAFAQVSGEPWTGLSAYHSVDTTDPDAPPPPCMGSASDLEGNALYCEPVDAIAWDRAALFPVLTERFGDAAVVVVLAHEVGHAVASRLGVDLALRGDEPDTYPTILVEAMADCYAGAFIRWVTDGNAPRLQLDRSELDQALGALVVFRDPVGTAPGDTVAHGNGFDRISSFQDGYERGPGLCADFTVEDREFTQAQFSSVTELATGGNLPLDELITTMAPNLDSYFDALVQGRGGEWQPLAMREAPGGADCSGDQGPVAYCPRDGTVEIDRTGDLRRWHTEVGDYATGVLLASRYGLAAVEDLESPVLGPAAGLAGLCLAGSYTGNLLVRDEGFALSPGDLDEAVQVLLAFDHGARDAGGKSESTGFERVAAFRAGALGGDRDCTIE